MKYQYELCKGFRLYGQEWVPIRESISYLLDLRDWIKTDTRRLTLLVLRLSMIEEGPDKEDYEFIFLDLKKRLLGYSLEEEQLVTFIGQSYEALLNQPTKANGVPRHQHNTTGGRRKGSRR